MKNFRKCLVVLVAALLFAFVPASLSAQARQSLALARVQYNTRKNTVKPEGELKEQIAALDRELAEATRLGKTGEVRRLLAKGMALLSGREWDRALEYSSCLALRAEEVYVDSGRPWALRVEQSCVPKVELTGPVDATASIHRLERSARGPQPGEKVRDLGVLNGVGRDLLDEPVRIEAGLTGLPDGRYLVQVEMREAGSVIGKPILGLELLNGLQARIQALTDKEEALQGFDDLRADVLYPVDYVRRVNRGLIEMGAFNLERELVAAEAVLESLKAGRNPYEGRKGDMERHHLLEGAGEIMPYRVYVPSRYTGKEPLPLIIALHGLGATQDSFFDSYGRQFTRLAEERGYIVAAPLGYRVDGGYGVALFGGGDPPQRRKVEYSAKDVMTVLDLMKKHYAVDPDRIYLTGHSMGAIGTWYLAPRYPDVWAALAPFSGYGDPSTLAKIRHIPQIVIHGDADPTVSVTGSRRMVEEMKRLGIEHLYIEVPGGNHVDMVMPNFPAVFDFFDRHSRKASR